MERIQFKWKPGTFPEQGIVLVGTKNREIGTVTRDPINKAIFANISVLGAGISISNPKATLLKKQISDWYEAYQMENVTVTNLMSGKDVQIPRYCVGTGSDPSTETYWCM